MSRCPWCERLACVCRGSDADNLRRHAKPPVAPPPARPEPPEKTREEQNEKAISDQEKLRNEADAPDRDCMAEGGQAVRGTSFGLGVDWEQANRWNEAMIHELTAALAQKDADRTGAEFASRHARVELSLACRENEQLKRAVAAEQASHASTLRRLQQLVVTGSCDPKRDTIRPRNE